jgi:hypothetical protein
MAENIYSPFFAKGIKHSKGSSPGALIEIGKSAYYALQVYAVLQERTVADYTLHARIDGELKRRIVEYVEANRKTSPNITAFVLAAVEEKLDRAAVDERGRTGQILLDLLREDEEFRRAVLRELR